MFFKKSFLKKCLIKDKKMFDYGKRISFLRKKMNISTRKLAAELEVYPSTISRIETGQGFPSVQILDDVIKYFGLSYSDFFDDESEFMEATVLEKDSQCSPKVQITADEMDMIVAYRKASEAERTAINALLGQYKSTDNLGVKHA